MVITVHHYRIRRGIRLLDAEMPDWRDYLDCEAQHVLNVLDVLREEMSHPFNIEPKVYRHFATLQYYGLHGVPGELWLELMNQPVPVNILPLGPPQHA